MAGIAPLGLVPKRRTAILMDSSIEVDPAWPVVFDVGEQFYFKPESGQLLGSPADQTPMAPCDVQPDELDIATAVDRIERAADGPTAGAPCWRRCARPWQQPMRRRTCRCSPAASPWAGA
jgi:D-arginine dehydrogenase